ncbi:hypothetical protein OOK31_38505 [Streptomyces sp. NBC_00249]|uniref:hypothetical protein n=1 Tax=Streptomyces sp. NBC_00249 TaxID=2975690 RepID=UPI0022568791|nr:hypothetical protein [Streptomyces sp. NBC_00249]MCX5199704.1 hypothetical protein [Streptomyces sp. NBC_00249]
MEKTSVTAWIYASHAARFELLKKRYREEERATVTALVREGKKMRQARIIVAGMRAVEWPSLATIVAAAVDVRLSAPDLAGPWRPLSDPERDRLALSGRWPGPATDATLVQRNYALPSPLVERLRTAAWRVSEEPLSELEGLGLVGSGLRLSEDQVETRNRLAARLYPVPRIIREALRDADF